MKDAKITFMVKYKLNFFVPLIFIISITSLIILVITYLLHDRYIHKQKIAVTPDFYKVFNSKIEYEASILDGYLNLIKKDKKIQLAFLKRDKEELVELTKNIYKDLNNKIKLTHFYFIQNDDRVFLRVHDIKRDLDIIPRYTYKKAKEFKAPFWGIEFGIKKNYTLRVVHPWVVDGKIIGYMELGKEIDMLIQDLSQNLKTEIYIAVKKSVYKNIPDFVAKRLENTPQSRDYYFVYKTYDLPPNIEEIFSVKNNMAHILFNKRHFHLVFSKLTDVSSRDLGYFIFLIDTSLEYKIMQSTMAIFTIAILIITFILISMGIFFAKKKEKEINELTTKLENIAILDGLTGLLNRKYFNEQIPLEIQRARRDEKFITMIMIDVDYFKKYNDIYGHQAGDEALQKIAVCMKKIFMRSGDLIFRLGGEEFAIIFSHKKDEKIEQICKKLSNKIKDLKIKHSGNEKESYLTISMGIATKKADKNLNLQSLYKLSDDALYQAKNRGRNQIVVKEK